jgi:hypothetical protein
MWQAQGRVVEMRIPWMLLGFTDPSSLQVMSYDELGGKMVSTTTKGIRVLPWIVQRSDGRITGLNGAGSGGVYPVSKLPVYTWPAWNKVQSVERLKKSYYVMQDAFHKIDEAAPGG